MLCDVYSSFYADKPMLGHVMNVTKKMNMPFEKFSIQNLEPRELASVKNAHLNFSQGTPSGKEVGEGYIQIAA